MKDKPELFGLERATTLVEDWYVMFEWSENPVYKDAIIEIVRKYDENVVRNVVKTLTMELTPRYLPKLSTIDQALSRERLNQRQNYKDNTTLEDLANNESGGKVQQLYLRGLKRLMSELGKKQITFEEYLRKQGDFFKFHKLEDDAKFFYTNADREKKGLKLIQPDDWERSSERSSERGS